MFRFTIRDVLWLTVVAGLGVAWWLDRERVWKRGESSRQLVDGLRSSGVNPETLLKALQANPSGASVTINPRPARAVTSVKVTKAYRDAKPFGNSDYQAPPRPPLRISDEERP